MGNLTLLRVMAVMVFWEHGELVFPWWMWLWAVLAESDHMLNSFVDYKCNYLMMKEFENGAKEVPCSGGCPKA
jgi:hypothetical protein